MKYKWMLFCFTALFLWALAGTATAHFGMVIPSDTMVMSGDQQKVTLIFSFSHPMEMLGMNMAKPKKCAALFKGEEKGLSGLLKETIFMGHRAWTVDFQIDRPGVFIFFMEPVPYWEPSEDVYIIHYTKSLVGAFGDESGWDQPVGLKTEIIPLTRPFGLYSGNVFQGIVLMNGVAVPYSDIEVEYYNHDKRAKVPNDFMVTQSLKADGNGVFTVSVPKPGWWGFAALNTSDKKILRQGKFKDVELGAVLWVRFLPWQEH